MGSSVKKRGRPALDNPKNRVISTRITEDLVVVLDNMCEKEDCTRSTMLENLIKLKQRDMGN